MSNIKDILNRLLAVMCVKKCVGCKELLAFDYEGSLCPRCAEEWDEAKSIVCDRCYEMQSKCSCGFGKRYVDSVRHLALYDHTKKDYVVNRLVYALKKSNNDEVFDFVAREMANILVTDKKLDNTVVVNIPRSPTSVRRYGYDHAKKLAKRVSELLNVEYVDALGHLGGKTEQKMLNKQQREQNAKNNCYIKQDMTDRLKGKTVFLVDDIGTTGAMTGVCAELLHKNGVIKVKCILAAKNKL